MLGPAWLAALRTGLDMRSHFIALAVCALALPAAAQDMLALDVGGGVHRVDSRTGVRGQVGTLGTSALYNCLAVTPSGVVYTVGGTNVMTIDPQTGAGTIVAQVSGGPVPLSPRGLAYRPLDGMLLAVFDVGWDDIDELWEIDPVSGVATPVGPTGGLVIQALTFDPSGVLYAYNLSVIGLCTLDQNTGLATDVGAADGVTDVQFLTVTGDGRLFGGRNTLYEFDRATGVRTAIANIPNEFVDLRGCDWIGLGCETEAVANRYCAPANANSTGASAYLLAAGCGLVSANRVSISAQALPVDQFGYFLASRSQGFVPFAGGSQGTLCVSGQIARYRAPIPNSGFFGAIGMFVDLGAIPLGSGPVAVQPGETWNFQAWYRDLNPGPTSNFTDAVSITFL
jgi:hypothetical protein